MTLLAGAARVEFTPPAGFWMFGFGPHPSLPGASSDYAEGYTPRLVPAQGALDPLHARAIVVSNGQFSLALVSLDLLEVPGPFCALIRARISERTGIHASSVLINVSHTHSGPDWGSATHTTPDHVSRAIQEAAVEAVVSAHDRLQPAHFGFGIGSCQDVAVNRQDPRGPIDPEVAVFKFEAEDGQLIAAAVKYACHPIVLEADNLLYSADYPGVVCAALEGVFPNAVVSFLQGTAGNINPVAYPSEPKENIFPAYKTASITGRPHPCTPKTMRAIGQRVAAEALAVLAGAPVGSGARLGSASKHVELPLKSKAERQLFCDFIGIHQDARPRFLDGEVWQTEVQALQIGAVQIVALPGEPYVELGLRLRAAHPEALVVPLGYSNDSIYYVPMDSNQSERRYENVAAVVALGSQGRLESAANELIEQLS